MSLSDSECQTVTSIFIIFKYQVTGSSRSAVSTDVQTGVSTGVEAGSSVTVSGFGHRGGLAGSGTGVLALDDGRERALVGRGCAERLRRLASSSCRRSKSSFFSSRCRDTLRNGRAADLDAAAATGFCRIEGGTGVIPVRRLTSWNWTIQIQIQVSPMPRFFMNKTTSTVKPRSKVNVAMMRFNELKGILTNGR